MANNRDVDQTLGRRREERAAEEAVQNYASGMQDLALEVWQKQLALGEQIMKMWLHLFTSGQELIAQHRR
jgi:hypothetical protein